MNNLISFKIDNEELKKIDKLAEIENRSRSNLIKLILKKYLLENATKTRSKK